MMATVEFRRMSPQRRFTIKDDETQTYVFLTVTTKDPEEGTNIGWWTSRQTLRTKRWFQSGADSASDDGDYSHVRVDLLQTPSQSATVWLH